MALPGTLEHHHPSELRLYHRNARAGNVPAIAGSLRTLDQYKPVLVNRGTHTGRPLEVLAGNHTVKAIRDLAEEYPSDERWQVVACWVIDVDEDAVQRTVLADNRTAELGGYDDRLLLELLAEVDESAGGLTGTGFEHDDLAQLEALLNEEDGEPGEGSEHDDAHPDGEVSTRAPTTGEMLLIVDVTTADPTTKPAHGSVWSLGHHLLVVARLGDEHQLWSEYLPDRLLAPYPDPYITTTTTAQERPLLLVQPNEFMAGHLIDKHTSAYPDQTVIEIPQ